LYGLAPALASDRYQSLIEAHSTFGNYSIGPVKKLPVPASELSGAVTPFARAFALVDWIEALDETSRSFSGSIAASDGQVADLWNRALAEIECGLVGSGLELDQRVRAEIAAGALATDALLSSSSTLLSAAVGAALGRWDVGKLRAFDAPSVDTLPPDRAAFAAHPTAPYPLLASGAASVLPADAVAVLDRGHSRDLVSLVYAVLRALEIEERPADSVVLDEGSLRGWLSREFFAEHIARYSKSRRKAPVYWQVATPTASYSVWIYYHRLTADTLYCVLSDFVGPKLKHEERRLANLSHDAGPNPAASQREELAAQEHFVSELRALHEDIALVAPIWKPDLNDGVIINFAPLWRLVPHHRAWQKDCKSTWDKLCNGGYDWAHLAMHLWPERVVPKCSRDRSIAIAHGLEDVFWHEDSNGKWQPRKVAQDDIDKLVRERTSAAVKDALNSLLDAPVPATGRTRRKKAPRAKGTRKNRASARPRAAATSASSSSRATAAADVELLSKVKEAIGANGDGTSKADVIDATGISASEWNKAIKALLADGSVTQTGERRGARYHLGGGDA